MAPCEHLWRFVDVKVYPGGPHAESDSAEIFQRCLTCGAVQAFGITGRAKVHRSMAAAIKFSDRLYGGKRA